MKNVPPGRQRGSSVSALFPDRDTTNKATRALQKELGLRPGDLTVVMVPASDPGPIKTDDGYLGITKVGGRIVHARALDADWAAKIRALMTRLGGEVIGEETFTPSTGGYGPTTAHGARSVFGGRAETSPMAHQRYTFEEPSAEPPKSS